MKTRTAVTDSVNMREVVALTTVREPVLYPGGDLRILLVDTGCKDNIARSLLPDASKVHPLSRVDATHWTISFTGLEGTQLEYKYALGDWTYVEKGDTCNELSNRTLTLDYGTTGVQTVNDTVANWNTYGPCGS